MTAKIIHFPKPSDPLGFAAVLQERVYAYFKVNNISKYGGPAIYWKTGILFGALLTIYTLILSTSNYWLLFGVLYPFLGHLRAAIGMGVFHDAAHKSYSKNQMVNAVMTFIAGDCMGGSGFMWGIQHNILHHTYTNIEDFDPDIAKYPIFRFDVTQKRLPFHKYQYLYAIPLYMVTTLYWIYDDWRKFIKKDVYPPALKREMKMDKVERRKFVAGKLFTLVFFLIIPMFVIGWWQALIGLFCMHALFGLTLALVFQIAHVVEDSVFPTPQSLDEWMKHQIKTTWNFGTLKKFLSWLVGGLNFQIEHHLFSDISHVHYPTISTIVEGTCIQFGIPYQTLPTFRKGVRSHFARLKAMGVAEDAIEEESLSAAAV